MSDFAKTTWTGTNGVDTAPHPPREQLLQYADGEVSDNESGLMKSHLDACWKCRARLAEIEAAITAFSRFDDEVLTLCLPPPPSGWRGFEGRLRQLVATNTAPSLRYRWRGWWAHTLVGDSQPRWATALALVGCLAVMSFWLLRSTSVSARELLQRSIQAENTSLQQVAEPVLYRKLQVRRTTAHTTESVSWESWRTAKGDQFRQRIAGQQGTRYQLANDRVAPPLLIELEQILRLNHLDAQRPLSAAVFAEWRASLGQNSETVAEDKGGVTLTISVAEPYAINAIREASLLFRNRDWQAITLRLQVQGEGEVRSYELSETAYEVLPLQALTVFADLAPTPSPLASPTTSPTLVAALPLASASPSATPTVALPSAAALQEAEVAALFTLHQLQADLGEQLEVLRDANRQIIVRGLVETAARKQQLNEALRAVPLVILKLQTVEEAAREVTAKAPDKAAETNTIAESQISASAANATSANPLHQHLEKYFTERGNERRNAALRAAQLSDTVVSEAAAALSEAWALRRLAERFKPEQEDEFTAVNRQRITEMMRNHLVRLQAARRSLRTQLDPVLSALAGTIAPPAVNSAGNRQTQALQLFKAVEQFAQLSNSLFAGTGAEAARSSPVEAARRTLTALAQMDGALQSFEQTMSK